MPTIHYLKEKRTRLFKKNGFSQFSHSPLAPFQNIKYGILNRKKQNQKNKTSKNQIKELNSTETKNPQSNLYSRIAKWVFLAFLSLIGLISIGLLKEIDIHWKILLTPTLSIDAYGAIFPTILAFSFLILCLKYLQLPLQKYVNVLGFSIFLTFLFSQVQKVPTGAATFSVPLVATMVSLVVTISIFGEYSSTNTKKTLLPHHFQFSKKKYLLALLTTSSAITLSAFLVDLALWKALNSFILRSYIGGGGLADGIMISIVLAPITTTFVTSLLFTTNQIAKLDLESEPAICEKPTKTESTEQKQTTQ